MRRSPTRRRDKDNAARVGAPKQGEPEGNAAALGRVDRAHAILGAIALIAGIWSYWPTLAKLAASWESQPDYSHGYLVVPLAVGFLWARRASLPPIDSAGVKLGLGLFAISLVARYFAGRLFLEFVDGYSIVLWAAGVVAVIFGRGIFWWALPSIGFLFFMVPLPYGAEIAFSHPLQRVATRLSCMGLVILGQPAFAEGNVILLGDHHLEIAQACSGLRLFVSVMALGYCYLLLAQSPLWQKALLLVATLPIAILSNSARIVATGLLYQYSASEVARRFAHDFAGWAMIPLAAVLFACVLWYCRALVQEEEVMRLTALIDSSRLGLQRPSKQLD